MSSVTSGPPATGLAPAERAAAPASRLAWLDALRGFAALCVVFDHGTSYLLLPARYFVYRYIDPGQFGVFVFFLVSGYIVPASLERKGSVRSFWISRAFRLYPMFLVALALAWVADTSGHWNGGHPGRSPATAAASWLLMLPNVLSGQNVPNVTWTLSYEMVFYLLIAALFSWQVHRRSGGYALGFAIGAVALGGVLPMAALAHWGRHGGPSPLTVDIAADALIVSGVAVALAMNGLAARIGASVAALTGLVLLTVNQAYPHPWSGLTILALMFTGTLVYRAEQGQAGKLGAAWIAGAVLALTIAAGVWHGAQEGLREQWRVEWVVSIVAAAGVFAVGLAVRNRKVPRWAAWLGLISYSVYLLHPLVFPGFHTFRALDRHFSMPIQIVLWVGLVALVIAASAVTYYAVEQPMQRLGRRLARGHWVARDRRTVATGRSGYQEGTGAGAGASAAQARSTSSSRAVAGGSGGSP